MGNNSLWVAIYFNFFWSGLPEIVLAGAAPRSSHFSNMKDMIRNNKREQNEQLTDDFRRPWTLRLNNARRFPTEAGGEDSGDVSVSLNRTSASFQHCQEAWRHIALKLKHTHTHTQFAGLGSLPWGQFIQLDLHWRLKSLNCFPISLLSLTANQDLTMANLPPPHTHSHTHTHTQSSQYQAQKQHSYGE